MLLLFPNIHRSSYISTTLNPVFNKEDIFFISRMQEQNINLKLGEKNQYFLPQASAYQKYYQAFDRH